jgi:hypothetical protein
VRSAVAKDHALGLARIDVSGHMNGANCYSSHTKQECVVLRAGTFELAVQVSE